MSKPTSSLRHYDQYHGSTLLRDQILELPSYWLFQSLRPVTTCKVSKRAGVILRAPSSMLPASSSDFRLASSNPLLAAPQANHNHGGARQMNLPKWSRALLVLVRVRAACCDRLVSLASASGSAFANLSEWPIELERDNTPASQPARRQTTNENLSLGWLLIIKPVSLMLAPADFSPRLEPLGRL